LDAAERVRTASDRLVILAKQVVEVCECDRCGKDPGHMWTITGPKARSARPSRASGRQEQVDPMALAQHQLITRVREVCAVGERLDAALMCDLKSGPTTG
jgi:hypothetical protein